MTKTCVMVRLSVQQQYLIWFALAISVLILVLDSGLQEKANKSLFILVQLASQKS